MGNKKGEFLKGLIIERKLKKERCNDFRKNTNAWKSSKAPEVAGKVRLGPTQETPPKREKPTELHCNIFYRTHGRNWTKIEVISVMFG